VAVREVVVTVSVEFCLPPAVNVTLVGLRLADGECPPLGETVDDRLTVPAKPLMLVRVILVAFEEPGMIASVVVLDVILKPTTFAETVAPLTSPPLVPRILTAYVFGVAALRVAVELAVPPAVRVTLEGLNVTVTPVGNEMALNVTVPEKPFRLVTVTMDVLVDPALKLTLVGVAESLKSVTMRVIGRVAVSVLVSPVVVLVTV
jgi:hypothetical protein